jgi:translation elongation factor EF-1alpha
VKARGERRRVRLDWVAVERERGISVSSAVMSFEHQGLAFNLLDTPATRRRLPPALPTVPVPGERRSTMWLS